MRDPSKEQLMVSVSLTASVSLQTCPNLESSFRIPGQAPGKVVRDPSRESLRMVAASMSVSRSRDYLQGMALVRVTPRNPVSKLLNPMNEKTHHHLPKGSRESKLLSTPPTLPTSITIIC